jgi:hypothetical protein
MYFENESGGVLVEAKDLVNGVSITQAEQVDRVEYFHIELETHDVILAEGALSETFVDDDSRAMFHNAHEYAALYPEDVARPARYRAPRLEIGYEVEAIRRKLAARAGLLSDGQDAGTLRGHIDAVSPRLIEGWAQSVDHPEAPVCLDIYAGGELIGQTLANRYREDLEAAGLGSGRHGFSFAVPDGLMLLPGTVEVRRSLDGARRRAIASGDPSVVPQMRHAAQRPGTFGNTGFLEKRRRQRRRFGQRVRHVFQARRQSRPADRAAQANPNRLRRRSARGEGIAGDYADRGRAHVPDKRRAIP